MLVLDSNLSSYSDLILKMVLEGFNCETVLSLVLIAILDTDIQLPYFQVDRPRCCLLVTLVVALNSNRCYILIDDSVLIPVGFNSYLSLIEFWT